jgi:hypothetical protein
MLLNAQLEHLRSFRTFECGLRPIPKPEKLPISAAGELRSA